MRSTAPRNKVASNEYKKNFFFLQMASNTTSVNDPLSMQISLFRNTVVTFYNYNTAYMKVCYKAPFFYFLISKTENIIIISVYIPVTPPYH